MRTRLTEEKVRSIRKYRAKGWPLKEIAYRYGITVTQVSRIALLKTWKHVI